MPRVLIAYGTRHGSTRDVAEAVAETLRSEGLDADVRAAAEVDDLSGHAAVVVGGGVYGGKWHPDALAFLERHREALRVIPVACFALGMSFVRQDDDAERQRSAVSDQIRRNVAPVDIACFAGSALGYPFIMRVLTRLMRAPQGDHRDWDAIAAWARRIAPALSAAS